MKSSESIDVKDLIQLVGSLSMGATSFFGLNYWLGDSIFAISLSIGVVIFAAVFGLVYIMVKAKKAVENIDRAKIVEYVTLGGYAIVAVVAAVFTLHYLTIEMNKKAEIKIVAEKNISEIDLISTAYKEQVKKWEDNFRVRLRNEAEMGISKRGLAKECSEEDIQTAVGDYLTNSINQIEGVNKSYNAIETKANVFKNDALAAVGTWSYFSIMSTLAQIDKTKEEYINDLVALSKQVPEELKDMTFEPPVTVTVSSKLSELETIDFDNGAYGLWVAVVLLSNFMALFPYLFGTRENMKLGRGKLEGGFVFNTDQSNK
jgi:hypothetical protein